MKVDEIEFGVLSCVRCGASYPVIEGVGVFFPANLLPLHANRHEKDACARLMLNFDFTTSPISDGEKAQLKVAENWSYQWNTLYDYTLEDLQGHGFFGEKLFFTFIPVEPRDIQGKNVVVWCCGAGKEAYHLSKKSPAVLVANEIGDEIYKIRKKIDKSVNLLLIRCDMTNNPLAAGWADVSICDHALQHVPNHQLGFEKLVAVLKPHGLAAICVYSYENNFLMTHIIEPLKHLIHKIPIGGQRAIAFFPALAIYLLIHCLYLPAAKLFPARFVNNLPLFEHMIFWSKDSLSFIWIACFDLIQAPVSYHFKKQEVSEMAHSQDLEIEKLTNTHGTTWSMVGRKINV
jgi:ubiquinone/menaquinone biosynthesis C-methylase UbiE